MNTASVFAALLVAAHAAAAALSPILDVATSEGALRRRTSSDQTVRPAGEDSSSRRNSFAAPGENSYRTSFTLTEETIHPGEDCTQFMSREKARRASITSEHTSEKPSGTLQSIVFLKRILIPRRAW